MLYLNYTPYLSKKKIQEMGAVWNPRNKRWYVESRANYINFANCIIPRGAMETTIVCDYFYLVSACIKCWNCGASIWVFGFAVEDHINAEFKFDAPYHSYPVFIRDKCFSLIQPDLDFLNDYEWRKWLLNNLYCYHDPKRHYFANHCRYCNRIQGWSYLVDKYPAPFNVNSPQKAQQLNFLKMPLSRNNTSMDIINRKVLFMTPEQDLLIRTYSRSDCFSSHVLPF